MGRVTSTNDARLRINLLRRARKVKIKLNQVRNNRSNKPSVRENVVGSQKKGFLTRTVRNGSRGPFIKSRSQPQNVSYKLVKTVVNPNKGKTRSLTRRKNVDNFGFRSDAIARTTTSATRVLNVAEDDEDLEHANLDTVSPLRRSSFANSQKASVSMQGVSSGSIQSRLGPKINAGVQQSGTWIQITNLHPQSVSQSDVQELLSGIGAVSAVHMSQPGSAFVSFVNPTDATTAVQIYHNRNLDGQPMQCKIIKMKFVN